MVTEHNICTMVMLSNEKTWQYWEDAEVTFGSIKVTLTSTEKLPSYVKREFLVYNTKVEEEVKMAHFAYLGYGNMMEDSADVPADTHGLLGLVEHAMAHKIEASLPGPIAVHCK